MQTTNNNNEIVIDLIQDKIEIANFPQTKEEDSDILEIIAQNSESTTKMAVATAQKRSGKEQWSIKHIVQALFYALQWPQLKRQLSKDAFEGMVKRHWPKATVGSFALFLFFSLNSADETGAATPNYYKGQEVVAAAVVDGRSTEMLVVSEDAKANYIARFSSVAVGEMRKFGIPASITLGLAILHSNYGASELAQGGHNHFDITCADNHLAEGLVGRNIHQGECYIQYQNAWTSFRANSLKLNAAHYKELKEIAGADYNIWISGLQKMGYPKADDLLVVIEAHQLFQFDQ